MSNEVTPELDTLRYGRIHRYNNVVGVYIRAEGDDLHGEAIMVYLTPQRAQEMAHGLLRAAGDIVSQPDWSRSKAGNFTFGPEAD